MAGPFVVSRNGVVITAPPQFVFNYLADVSRHGEWNREPGFRETVLYDGEPGLGSALRREKNGAMRGPLIIRGGMGDNPVQVVKIVTITAFLPYIDLTLETRNSYNGLLASVERSFFNLQEDMEGTQVTMVTEVEPMVPGAFIGPIYAIRIVRGVFERLLGRGRSGYSPKMPVGPLLGRIKEAVETGHITGNI